MTLAHVRGFVGLHELVTVISGGNGARKTATIRLRGGAHNGEERTVAWRSRTHRSRVRVAT